MMRINCEVQVNSRQLASQNLSVKRRGTRSSLAIGKQPGKLLDSSGIFIHICTLQNKQGTKFKIRNNIQAVFTKFVEEGKFTIQLKEPSVDICVKTDSTLAKGFLKLLKLALGNTNLDKLPFSHLNPVKQSQIEKPKTKLTISSRKDYPLTCSFPSTLEYLSLISLQLNRIEKRITNLKFLCSLDVSENQIIELPIELGNMPCLSVLNLRKNKISSIPGGFFSGTTRKTLSSLDLSDNDLAVLPHSIIKLKKLDTLNLRNNKLRGLPLSINKMRLKHLNVGKNLLRTLPASIQSFTLDSLDVSDNPFDGCEQSNEPFTSVKSLKELSGVVCIQYQMDVNPSIIPYTLCEYLDHYSSCLCGRIVLETYILGSLKINLKQLATSIISDNITVLGLATFCSSKCKKRYTKYQ